MILELNGYKQEARRTLNNCLTVITEREIVMENTEVMIVEDNPDIREGVRILLESEGYSVFEAESGEEALKQPFTQMDIIILDIMMPGMSGIKTCEEIRKTSNVPILFLTAKSQDSDKTMGLMAGGDDYLTKPFSYSELLARVKALLRRYQVYKGKGTVNEDELDTYLVADDLKVNDSFNEVWKNDEEIELTDIEYKILVLLMKHRRRVFSTQNIYESVWEEPYFYISNGTVMVHIRKLRVKIEDDPQNPRHIKTIWGRGYRFD